MKVEGLGMTLAVEGLGMTVAFFREFLTHEPGAAPAS